MLIDLTFVPNEIKGAIVDAYEADHTGSKHLMMQYFINKKFGLLKARLSSKEFIL